MDALLNLSTLPHNAIDFNSIDSGQYLSALEKAIEISKERFEQYKNNTDFSFKSIVEGLDEVSEKIDYVSSIFYSMYSADATETLRDQSQEFSSKLTEFSNMVSLDEKVFEKIKSLYDKKEELNLTSEQARVLEKYYSDLTRNGALLAGEKKERLKEINKKMSELSLKYADNIVQSVNSLFLHVKDEDQLTGISKDLKKSAANEAKDKDLEGFVFTLDYPVMSAFLKSCSNRALREEYYKIIGRRGNTDKISNKSLVLEELNLRRERAELLGFRDHVHFTLEKRMAKNEGTVLKFIEDIYEKAIVKARNEFNELSQLAKDDGIEFLEPWDVNYYSEKLRTKVLNFNDEVLRPYFPIDKVMDGLFDVANKLFNLEFKLNNDLPKYHEDVLVYEVHENGDFIGLFNVDLYPRKTKKPGAWMTNLFEQGYFEKEVRRPQVAIVCNFTKPTDDKPSLLTFGELTTLYHEFGHALHGLLSKCRYRSVSGTSVYWDFVELPSQIMENWVKEKECLDLFAAHYETGEKIPSEIIEKIKESNKFLEGLATVRQLSFALLDIKYHTLSKEKLETLNVEKFERDIMDRFSFYKNKSNQNLMSYAFGHLFAGGYSSGYYSYKWAELLDADAFEEFVKVGIFNKEKAKSFKENILEKGGSEDPLELYQRFKGGLPDSKALFRRAGL